MNHDKITDTIEFTAEEVRILNCEDMMNAKNNVINLQFAALDFVAVKQDVINELRSSGSQNKRGMIPSVQRQINVANRLASELRIVAQELYPEFYVE
jgi:hypothetical protein